MKLVFSTNSFIKPNQNFLEKKIRQNRLENPISDSYVPRMNPPENIIIPQNNDIYNAIPKTNPSITNQTRSFSQNNSVITSTLSMNMFNRIIQTSDCNCGK